MNHEIIIETEVDGAEEYADLLRQVIPAALEAQGVDVPCEVDVLFTDDEGIHQINLEQRGVDRPTDVLSFPMFDLQPGEHPAGEDADPGTGLVPLGDMVTAPAGRRPIWPSTRYSTCWGTTIWTRARRSAR